MRRNCSVIMFTPSKAFRKQKMASNIVAKFLFVFCFVNCALADFEGSNVLTKEKLCQKLKENESDISFRLYCSDKSKTAPILQTQR